MRSFLAFGKVTPAVKSNSNLKQTNHKNFGVFVNTFVSLTNTTPQGQDLTYESYENRRLRAGNYSILRHAVTTRVLETEM